MAEGFDPYHKWLGIRPKDQPPHHYRLLGIELFENDPDVISSAADQRMGHVRSFQTGKNAALSQKILNEIAAARICLLDGKKKEQYDLYLRTRLFSPSAEPSSPKPTPPEPTPSAIPPAEADVSASKSVPVPVSEKAPVLFPPRGRPLLPPKPRRKPETDLKVFIVLFLIIGAVLVLWGLRGRNPPSQNPPAPIPGLPPPGSLGSAGQNPPAGPPPSKISSPQPPAGPSKEPQESLPASNPPGSPQVPPEQQPVKEIPSESLSPPVTSVNPFAAGPQIESPPSPYAPIPASPGPQPLPPKTPAPPTRPEPGPSSFSIPLPEDKQFDSRTFDVNERVAHNNLMQTLQRKGQVVVIRPQNKYIAVLAGVNRGGQLHGAVIAYYSNQKMMTYSMYKEGHRDGIVKTWRENGERCFWGQYTNGFQNGISCFFVHDNPGLVVEYTMNKINAVHFLQQLHVVKNFKTLDEALTDPQAGETVKAYKATVTDMVKNENDLREMIRMEIYKKLRGGR